MTVPEMPLPKSRYFALRCATSRVDPVKTNAAIFAGVMVNFERLIDLARGLARSRTPPTA
jgi:hypothetical protein